MWRTAGGVQEFLLEIDILSMVSGGVRVRNVGGDQFLARTQQVHVSFELSGDPIQHVATVFCIPATNLKLLKRIKDIVLSRDKNLPRGKFIDSHFTKLEFFLP